MLLVWMEHSMLSMIIYKSFSNSKKSFNLLRISDNTMPLQQVLESIQTQLENTDMINKEIYFITDGQSVPWKDIDEVKLAAELFMIPVGGDSVRQNISSVSARYVPKILSGTNEPVIQAVIKTIHQNLFPMLLYLWF